MSGTVPYFDMYRAGSGIGQFVKVNEQRNIVAVLSIKQAHIVRCNIIEPADSDAAVDRCRDTSLNPPAIHSPNSGNREGIPADIIELRIGRMIGIELRQSSNIYGCETAVRNMIGTGVMNTLELTDTRLFISIITIEIGFLIVSLRESDFYRTHMICNNKSKQNDTFQYNKTISSSNTK